MAKKLDLVCCIYCGRDTRSSSGICRQCFSGKPFDDNRGRKGMLSVDNSTPYEKYDDKTDQD